MEQNVPFGQTNQGDCKKNVYRFYQRQIKFYLEFSRWIRLTRGPRFLKDLQADN